VYDEDNPWYESPYQDHYGDSHQSTSCNTWDTLIAGIGQGNGAGPPIWAVVSSSMFDIMRQDGFYALLVGAISQHQHWIVGFAFVDDTNLCITHHSDDAEQVLQHMQQLVTHWEGLLWAMGRALVLEKCFWHLVDFECHNNKGQYKQCNQVPGTLSILDTG